MKRTERGKGKGVGTRPGTGDPIPNGAEVVTPKPWAWEAEVRGRRGVTESQRRV